MLHGIAWKTSRMHTDNSAFVKDVANIVLVPEVNNQRSSQQHMPQNHIRIRINATTHMHAEAHRLVPYLVLNTGTKMGQGVHTSRHKIGDINSLMTLDTTPITAM